MLELKTQFHEIEKTRETLEQQKNIERVAIDKKLKTAAEMRDENMKKMLERLKEHVSFDFQIHFELNRFLVSHCLFYDFDLIFQSYNIHNCQIGYQIRAHNNTIHRINQNEKKTSKSINKRLNPFIE